MWLQVHGALVPNEQVLRVDAPGALPAPPAPPLRTAGQPNPKQQRCQCVRAHIQEVHLEEPLCVLKPPLNSRTQPCRF